MTPVEILDALSRLPIAERLLVLEAALRMTREEMAQGAAPPPEVRHSGPLSPSAETPEPRPAPRRSLDDVELDALDQEGEEQSFLRKIYRVFTQGHVKVLQGDVGWRLKIAPVGLWATKSACADWVGTFVLARAGVALAALASRGALETRLLHSPGCLPRRIDRGLLYG
jgi:hypothetical protein